MADDDIDYIIHRAELVRKLASIAVHTFTGESVPFHQVAKFLNECAYEFQLTTEEQRDVIDFVVKNTDPPPTPNGNGH